jgi:tetratricopeptide (TPR) repeat protein
MTLNINSKITLTLLFNLLIINNVFSKDAALDACEAAVYQQQYAQAVDIAAQHASQPEFWLCKGRAQAALQQHAQAEASFKQAITLKPQGLDLVSAYMLLGHAQKTANNTPAALASYQQALKFSEQQNMRRYVRIAHNLLGEAYYDNGQYAESLQAFQAGEKLALNDDERADSYVHEALSYHKLQQLDLAIEYQLKGVMMLRKSAAPEQYAEGSLVLAQLFIAKKDYVGAERTYQRLMEYAQENGGSFYEAKTAIHWAEVKRAQGDRAGAETLLAQAETISRKIQDDELTDLLARVRTAKP